MGLKPKQVSDMTSSYSCFCPKYLQQFANPALINQGLLGNQFMPLQLQQ